MLSGPGAGPAPVINDVMGTEDVTVGTTGIRILSCGCGGQGLDILKMLEEGETCALVLGVTFVILGLTNSGRNETMARFSSEELGWAWGGRCCW